MTFQETIIYIFKERQDLIKEYDRLNGTNLSKSLTPIEIMIDEATGCRDHELVCFFDFVRDYIFIPVANRRIEA